jgi:hypothetical protein
MKTIGGPCALDTSDHTNVAIVKRTELMILVALRLDVRLHSMSYVIANCACRSGDFCIAYI